VGGRGYDTALKREITAMQPLQAKDFSFFNELARRQYQSAPFGGGHSTQWHWHLTRHWMRRRRWCSVTEHRLRRQGCGDNIIFLLCARKLLVNATLKLACDCREKLDGVGVAVGKAQRGAVLVPFGGVHALQS
jgi:hypothetical protein